MGCRVKARTEGRSLCGHWGLLRAQPLATSLGRPGTSQKEQARQRLVEEGWPEAVSEIPVERPMMEDFPVIIICCYLSSTYYVLGTGPKHFVCIILEVPLTSLEVGTINIIIPFGSLRGPGAQGREVAGLGLYPACRTPKLDGAACLGPLNHPEVTAL